MREGRVTEGYRELIRFEVERTERMFDEGEALLPCWRRHIASRLRCLPREGGRSVPRCGGSDLTRSPGGRG